MKGDKMKAEESTPLAIRAFLGSVLGDAPWRLAVCLGGQTPPCAFAALEQRNGFHCRASTEWKQIRHVEMADCR